MGRTPDHWKTSSPRPNGLMARPGTESSNPSPSSAESAANFVFGREAWKGPRRRQGTIPNGEYLKRNRLRIGSHRLRCCYLSYGQLAPRPPYYLEQRDPEFEHKMAEILC